MTCEGENSDSKPFAGIVNIDDDVSTSSLSINPVTELSTGCNPKACWVYDDDTLQRKLELRESKISELLRKQEGLLQTIEKLGTTHFPTD